MFKVFRKRWKRAPHKPPKVSMKEEPQDVSSTGSDNFPNCDFDVEFRVGSFNKGTTDDTDIDMSSFNQPVEEIVSQESLSISDQLVDSSSASLRRSKRAKPPVAEIDLLPLFNEGEWLNAKRQLRRLQKNGSPQDICRVLTKRDSNDELILHIAAWKAPPGLFHFMVSMIEGDRADCFSLKDKDGNTPFHLLCANLSVDCVDFSIVEDTLMLDIGILCQPNSHGDTCLHLLIASAAFSVAQPVESSEEAAIEQLAGSILNSVGTDRLSSCKNAKGLSLLHIAVANQVHAGVLSELLQLAPDCSKDDDERGMLPLHYIAGSPLIPASFVEELIRVSPESIARQDKNGDTPLHLQIVNVAGRQNATNELNMLQVTALLLGEKLGEEALAFQISKVPSPSVLIQMLMDSPFSDEAAMLKTETGATALHVACESENVHELVDAIRLLSSNRGACSTTDCKGRTPLITAVRNPNVSAKAVKVLCRAYPKVLTVLENGMIPLQHALSMGPDANVTVVKALIKAAPETVNVTWNGNNALSEASKFGVPTPVANLLAGKSSGKSGKKSKRAKSAVVEYPKESTISSDS